MTDFLRLADFSPDDLLGILARARKLKAGPRVAAPPPMAGKVLGLVFRKASTRTRVSFEVGIRQLGGSAIVLTPATSHMGRGEAVRDTARVLSRYVDMLMVRTFAQSEVEEFGRCATVPVINGLTDRYHPCQIMADLLTIEEHLGSLREKRIAFVGDPNNVANSLATAAGLFGLRLTLAAPADYPMDAGILQEVRGLAKKSGGEIRLVEDPREAAAGADVLYTDTWTSMGKEEEAGARRRAFGPYQVNAGLLRAAGSGAIVMHCLPAHRGEEITDEVIDGPQSVVYDQAENRLHVQKAIMLFLQERRKGP